jgi:leucyl/phenylalanyl-tRNA--protein transferase
MVMFPGELKISRSLAKTLRQERFKITLDSNLDAVIKACAEPRTDGHGTWITQDMIDAYNILHQLGYAHSVEAWQDGQLVGGLYGIALGQVFFGESMFSRVSNASKVAFTHLTKVLQEKSFQLIDCQVETAHLASLGARNIPRHQFIELINQYCDTDNTASPNALHIPQQPSWREAT